MFVRILHNYMYIIFAGTHTCGSLVAAVATPGVRGSGGGTAVVGPTSDSAGGQSPTCVCSEKMGREEG